MSESLSNWDKGRYCFSKDETWAICHKVKFENLIRHNRDLSVDTILVLNELDEFGLELLKLLQGYSSR